MRKELALTAASIVTLVLAGCSAATSGETGNDAESASATPTVEATNAAEEPEEETSEEPAEDESEEPSEPERSARGNIVKELGEDAGFVDLDTGELMFRVNIEEFHFGYKCGSHSEGPANGNFVAFDIEAETTEAWPSDDFIQVTMHDFRAWDADGTRINDITENVYSCDIDNEMPYDTFRPSEKVRGTIVLDLPDVSWVSYDPYGEGGWEWLVERSK